MNEKEVARRSNMFMESLGYYYALKTKDCEVRIKLVSQRISIDCLYKRKDFSDIVLLEIHNYLYTSADSRLLSVLFFKNPLFITFGVYQNFTKVSALHKAVQYSINYCTSLSCLVPQIVGALSLLYVYFFTIWKQVVRRKNIKKRHNVIISKLMLTPKLIFL